MRSLLLCAAPALLAAASLALADGQFNIVGTRIYDPTGTEFIAHGVNIPGYNFWTGHDPTQDASILADDWGFNLVRVNNLPLTAPTLPGAGINLDNMIKAFTTDRIAAGKKPMVVMITPQESTDIYFEGTQLTNVAAWFRDLGNKYRNNPYVWFNVGNEPGDKQKPADWPADQPWDPFQPDVQKYDTMHQTVIQAIRDDVGNRNIIVADGIIDGQDAPWDDLGTLNPAHSAVLTCGNDIIHFNGKTYNNILFDTHIYGMWVSPGATPQRLEQYIQAVQAKNFALIFGEYNPNSPGTYKMANDLLALADKYRIGRAGWHWSDSGDNSDLTTGTDPLALGTSWATGGGYLIDDPTNPTNLTQWGQMLWNDSRDILTPRKLLAGDTNDDGVINADDYAAIDRGFAAHLDGWVNGDFNGDGVIDSQDYLILDTAFAQANAGSLSPSLLAERQSEFGPAYVQALEAAIPEPTMIGVLGMGVAIALLRRGRRASLN